MPARGLRNVGLRDVGQLLVDGARLFGAARETQRVRVSEKVCGVCRRFADEREESAVRLGGVAVEPFRELRHRELLPSGGVVGRVARGCLQLLYRLAARARGEEELAEPP